jgi:hypothetical protein
MKRNQLLCPNCQAPLIDLKSALKCESCDQHFKIKISKKGVNHFFFLFLPAITFNVSICVLNWKVEEFLMIPNRDILIVSLLSLGTLVAVFSLLSMSKEFEVGV